MRTLSRDSLHDHQACSHVGHRHVPSPRLRTSAPLVPTLKVFAVLGAIAGYCLGYNLAETPTQAKARVKAHDQAVVAAVEAGARRYNFQIPMFELDRSYRFEN